MNWIRDGKDVAKHDSKVSSWMNGGWLVVVLFTKIKKETMEDALPLFIPQTFWDVLLIIMDSFTIKMLLITKRVSFDHIHILGFRHIHMRLPVKQLCLDAPQAFQTQHFQINSPSSSPKGTPPPASQSQGITLSFNKKL